MLPTSMPRHAFFSVAVQLPPWGVPHALFYATVDSLGPPSADGTFLQLSSPLARTWPPTVRLHAVRGKPPPMLHL